MHAVIALDSIQLTLLPVQLNDMDFFRAYPRLDLIQFSDRFFVWACERLQPYARSAWTKAFGVFIN